MAKLTTEKKGIHGDEFAMFVCARTSVRSSVAFGPASIPSDRRLALFLSAAKQGSGERTREGKEEREREEEKWVVKGGRGCLHGQMDCSFSTHVEPCFVFHCRQAGAVSVALLARATHSYRTPHRSATHTGISSHTTQRAQTSPSFPAHMLKSSPLLSASKTQHPRLLCCCQVLPLADATGESYPSEVGLPREHPAPRYVQPPLM